MTTCAAPRPTPSACNQVGRSQFEVRLALLRSLSQDNSAFVRAVAPESLQKLGDKTAKPPEGFKAAELFTFPIYSPEQKDLY